MRRLLVIGIGVGDPDYLTLQAIKALNAAEVFFVLDKNSETADLVSARREVCERFIDDQTGYRTVVIADPPRDRTATDYPGAVRDWRAARARRIETAIANELGPDGCGAFMVWGDPSLYDGTLRILETLGGTAALVSEGDSRATPHEKPFEYEVIAGISSIHALAARHRITLNRVAGAVHITTGRRLLETLPDNAEDILVMLDADLACRKYRDLDIDIYWGAYLGSADEALIAGPLNEVIDTIADTRQALRTRKGWIMDSYLLRRNPSGIS